MPCGLCGARQTDPVRGASPWKRGVRRSAQVLICPDCQRDRDWTAELDRCPACGSTGLARSLGETSCRSCAATVPPGGDVPADRPPDAAPGLTADVEAALERLLRRTTDDR